MIREYLLLAFIWFVTIAMAYLKGKYDAYIKMRHWVEETDEERRK